jgi:hypothetical protein
MKWTGGHPYLTQRLCRVIANQNQSRYLETDVDSAVVSSFFGEMSEQDHNLRFVRDMLTKRAPDPGGVLATYRKILRGRHPVRDEEQSLVKSHLKLSGVVHRDNDVLRVRNLIFKNVFNRRWVRAHLPVNWKKRLQRAAIVLSASFVFAALVSLWLYARAQQQLAIAQQHWAQEADRARVEAHNARQQAEQQAQLASSRELAAAAINNLNIDPERSLLLALHAVSATYSADSAEASVTTEAEDALLQASRVRLTLSGHTGEVWGITFSPDGARLATASADRTAKVWDAASNQELRTLSGHSREVWSVVFSPDGARLATASADRTAKVWDAASGRELRTLSGHTGEVWGIAFSPDGARLATASADRTVKVWEAASGQELRTLSGHTGEVWRIAFSPDGTRLATASADRTAKVWEAASGRELRTLSGHDGGIWGIAFSPDGTRLATASADKKVRFHIILQDLLALARTRATRSLTSEECQKYLHKPCPPTP